jgi:hypothetical protein
VRRRRREIGTYDGHDLKNIFPHPQSSDLLRDWSVAMSQEIERGKDLLRVNISLAASMRMKKRLFTRAMIGPRGKTIPNSSTKPSWRITRV